MNIAAAQYVPQDWCQPVKSLPSCASARFTQTGRQNDAAQVNALAIVAHDLRGPLASLPA